ncbi:unnamed protein product [Rhodiola kirilowii]
MEKEMEVLASRFEGELAVSVKREARRKAEEEYKWAVVVRLSNGRPFNAPTMISAMKKAWNIKANLNFQEMAHNRMVVKLCSEEEHRRVLEGGPWTFDTWAVLVEKWKRGAAPGEYCSWIIRLWVQVHNVPAEYRDRAIPGELAELAGKVVKDESQDKDKDMRRRKWPRFRIEVDVRKPILHGVYLTDEDVKPVWIEFKYERLPLVCHRCGRLTHEAEQCLFEKEEPANKKFGKSLRAEMQTGSESVLEQTEEECCMGEETAGHEGPVEKLLVNGEGQKETKDGEQAGEKRSVVLNAGGRSDFSGSETLMPAVSTEGRSADELMREACGSRGDSSLGFERQGGKESEGCRLEMGRIFPSVGPLYPVEVQEGYGKVLGRSGGPSPARVAKLLCRRNRRAIMVEGHASGVERVRFHPYDSAGGVVRNGAYGGSDQREGLKESESNDLSAEAVAQPRRQQ